jgi:hypothetical protein
MVYRPILGALDFRKRIAAVDVNHKQIGKPYAKPGTNLVVHLSVILGYDPFVFLNLS